MFPLGGKAAVAGDHGPAVTHQAGLPPAQVDHGFNREHHARHQHLTGIRPAIVKDLRVLVEALSNAVTAVFTHHRTALPLGVFLDGVTDITQPDSGFDHFNTGDHRVVSNL